MRVTKSLTAGVLAVVLASASGCVFLAGAAVAGGAVAAYSYVKGEGSKTYAWGMDRVSSAANSALRQLDIIVISSSHDKLQGVIKARLRDDTGVDVNLKAESPHITQVKVRIGTFGDETRTQMIFGEIDRQLGI